jgi:hypothetical protein
MDATDVYLDGNNLPQLSQHAFIGKKNLKTLLLNNSQVNSFQMNFPRKFGAEIPIGRWNRCTTTRSAA